MYSVKYVLLSADGEISVFSVPNKVANNLQKYCLEFCCNWLYQSPEAAKFRVQMGDTVGVCYDEKDFIDYLNQYICDEQSTLIATLTDVGAHIHDAQFVHFCPDTLTVCL